MTLGYDIGTRLVMAMGDDNFSYESSLATHSIAGTFGAATRPRTFAFLPATRRAGLSRTGAVIRLNAARAFFWL